MRTRAIAVLIAFSCIVAAPIAASAASASAVAGAACFHGRIGGKRECLARGRTCNHRYEGQYLRYGYTCSKHHGKWTLSPEQQGQQQ